MLTPEIAKQKAQAVRVELAQFGVPPDLSVTCEECCANSTCEFAFDLYNTDGDCLDLK